MGPEEEQRKSPEKKRVREQDSLMGFRLFIHLLGLPLDSLVLFHVLCVDVLFLMYLHVSLHPCCVLIHVYSHFYHRNTVL